MARLGVIVQAAQLEATPARPLARDHCGGKFHMQVHH